MQDLFQSKMAACLRSLNGCIRDSKSSSVIQRFSLELISLAFLKRTTDIHIVVGEKKIMLRENGKLVALSLSALSREFLESVIRYFVTQTGSQNATTKDFYHEGSFSLSIPTSQKTNLEVSCRLSAIPCVTGQSMVIRLRDLKSLPHLNELGLTEEIERKLRAWVVEKYVQGGLVIVTGPTGSGKSTTLLSLLWETLVESNFSIAVGTIENPVEMVIPEFRQLEVGTFGDVSWETALLHFLRQDLDAVLVGEIRDPEVARRTFDFAETGHLAFTTLHTTGALSAITRLRTLGIPNDILAERIIGIASQRLLHHLCPDCKLEYLLSAKDQRYFENKGHNLKKAFNINPEGCPECHYTGVLGGKIPVVELFLNTPEAKTEFLNGSALERFEVVARNQGMKTMLESALEEVAAGNISPREVMLVLITPQDYAENT